MRNHMQLVLNGSVAGCSCAQNGSKDWTGPDFKTLLPPPLFYPFYPPHPPLACAGPISHLEGNNNPSPGTQHRQKDYRGDKEVHTKDATWYL